MKRYVLLLATYIIFFTLEYCRSSVFKEAPIFRRYFLVITSLALTYIIFKSFYKHSNPKKIYYFNLISLFVLFYLMQFIRVKVGLLPRYWDVSFIEHGLLTLLILNIYLGSIMFLTYLIKRFKKT